MNFIAADIVDDLRWQAPPQDSTVMLWIYLGAAVGLLVLGVVVFLLLRRRKAQAEAQAKRVVPPHIAALEALQHAKPMLVEEKALEFVVVVSRIVRNYIQHRFQIRASHRSSEEFLWEASASGLLSGDDQALLGRFLSRCDRVKFARGHVTREQMVELFDSAHRFVIGTIPPPEPEAPAKP